MRRRIRLLAMRRQLARLSASHLGRVQQAAAVLRAAQATGAPYIVIDRSSGRRWEIFDGKSPWLQM